MPHTVKEGLVQPAIEKRPGTADSGIQATRFGRLGSGKNELQQGKDH
jgi:hypothetical protein